MADAIPVTPQEAPKEAPAKASKKGASAAVSVDVSAQAMPVVVEDTYKEGKQLENHDAIRQDF